MGRETRQSGFGVGEVILGEMDVLCQHKHTRQDRTSREPVSGCTIAWLTAVAFSNLTLRLNTRKLLSTLIGDSKDVVRPNPNTPAVISTGLE